MAKHKIVVLQDAFNDLDDIFDYISNDSPANAYKTAERIVSRCEQLAEFPLMGKLHADGKLKSYEFRTIIEEPYLIFYRIIGKEIYIYRVLHGAKDILNAVNIFDL